MTYNNLNQILKKILVSDQVESTIELLNDHGLAQVLEPMLGFLLDRLENGKGSLPPWVQQRPLF